ncbi:Mevalonate kinase [Giardia lamblia P15]|uniref:Mevalonate kinase n=1 Tax=Giardia intestinalis (strain P15) TaxID=658858 RepID=E1F844_GIAIA|nr:Mevalonate kinase [Giardia lamblia P15]
MPSLDPFPMELYVRTPLKAILSGEHSVIYGHPCIAMALDLYTSGHARVARKATCPSSFPFPALLDIRTGKRLDLSNSMKEAIRLINEEVLTRLLTTRQSDTVRHYCESIDITVHRWALGKGLGSSASILVTHTALLLAASSNYSPSVLFDIALLGENHIHGKTTGMDLKTVIYGGIQIYNHDALYNAKISPDIFATRKVQVLIADSGVAKSTAQAVELVKQGGSKDTLARIGEISKDLIELLMNASIPGQVSDDSFYLAFSTLVQQNHNLLCSLGVTVTETECSRELLYHMGCFAAKLTGAGLGGCCIGFRTQHNSIANSSDTHVIEVGIGEGLLMTNTPQQI